MSVSSVNVTPSAKAQLAKAMAREAGFDSVGITHAGPIQRGQYYRDWLAAGYGGSMAYLGRNAELREAPERLLPGARSILCVGRSYPRGPAAAPDGQPMGRVAAYAGVPDYHVSLRRDLETVVARLRQAVGEDFGFRICVDTAPVLERELAERAGLGWIGRNTCLLRADGGSYLLLGEVITTLDLPVDEPVKPGCANCTRCIEACPTGALKAPYQLDASRCISYLTIEHRGEIPPEFHEAMGNWVYGCDICQEVCPYNRKVLRRNAADAPDAGTPPYLPLLDLVRLKGAEYRRITSDSAASRARLPMWRRNAAIALGNTRDLDDAMATAVNQALKEAAQDDDPAVRHAAVHALQARAAAAS